MGVNDAAAVFFNEIILEVPLTVFISVKFKTLHFVDGVFLPNVPYAQGRQSWKMNLKKKSCK